MKAEISKTTKFTMTFFFLTLNFFNNILKKLLLKKKKYYSNVYSKKMTYWDSS